MFEFDLESLTQAMSEDQFEDGERPVEIEEFVQSKKYLGSAPLSAYQYQIVKASTQIYKYETLEYLYGPKKAMERFEETKNLVILQLGKGCHAPYTPIYNAETGRWERLDSFVNANNTVVGYTDKELKHEYATESFLEGYGEMLRVKTSLGFEEDVYIKHKYYTWKKKDFNKRVVSGKRGPKWTEADQIEPGDRIALGMGYDIVKPKNIPIEHAHFLGYLIGDGTCPADHSPLINVDFGEKEVESKARYLRAIDYIGSVYSESKHPSKKMSFVRHSKKSKAVSLAKDYGLWNKRAHDKSIPDAVWASDNNVLSEFISALWSADGCVYMKKTNSTTIPVAEYCSISEKLAKDVQRALARLGVPAGIRSRIPTYTYKGEKRQGQRAYYITVNGSVNFKRFVSAIRLLDYKAEMVKKGLSIIAGAKYEQNMFAENLYWDSVKSVTLIGEGEYWTLTQPNSSNYVGDILISRQSGKDHCSNVACAYIAYLLLCLRDPASYYGKPRGNSIDIINIAINAQQANNVFFKNFVIMIENSAWFQGKYEKKAGQITFDKNVNVYSGHSERESWEGYNTLVVILDEISGFAMDSVSGNEKAKTADAIYKMYKASVASRFDEFGKTICLSFPRYKGDYISKLYDEAVAEKDIIQRGQTVKMNKDLPDGSPENEITIEWDEDNIISYAIPRVFALKRPTWEVNPTKHLENMVIDYVSDPVDFLSRFACMPPDSVDAFFRDQEKLMSAFTQLNGVDSDNSFRPSFQPEEEIEYFVHVDLAKKHDRCAVAMAHVETWKLKQTGGFLSAAPLPFLTLDMVRWWQPTKDKMVDFAEVRDFIISLRQRGFNVKLVTFDRWHSEDLIKYLNDINIKAEILSVNKKHYDDFAMVVQDERLKGPHLPILTDELKALRITPKGDVDHPRTGYKDLSDASCGALYNAIYRSSRDRDNIIEVYTYDSYQDRPVAQREDRGPIIKPPIPKELEDYLQGLSII